MRVVAAWWGMVLAGCGGQAATDDAATTCGTSAPEASAFDVTDAGLRQFGEAERRAIQVTGQVTDADGDLHRHTVLVWHDLVVDGTLDATRPDKTVRAEVSDTACGVASGRLGAVFPLGDAIPFTTRVEFGFVVEDAAGNPTNGGEPLILVITTPGEEPPAGGGGPEDEDSGA